MILLQYDWQCLVQVSNERCFLSDFTDCHLSLALTEDQLMECFTRLVRPQWQICSRFASTIAQVVRRPTLLSSWGRVDKCREGAWHYWPPTVYIRPNRQMEIQTILVLPKVLEEVEIARTPQPFTYVYICCVGNIFVGYYSWAAAIREAPIYRRKAGDALIDLVDFCVRKLRRGLLKQNSLETNCLYCVCRSANPQQGAFWRIRTNPKAPFWECLGFLCASDNVRRYQRLPAAPDTWLPRPTTSWSDRLLQQRSYWARSFASIPKKHPKVA